MTVSFAIVLLFQALFQPREPAGPDRGGTWAALAPLLVYGSGLGFQLLFGHPVETRAVAFFAMGLPVFVALVAWWQWTHPGKDFPA